MKAFAPLILCLLGCTTAVADPDADAFMWQIEVTPPMVTTSGLTHRSYVPPEYPRDAWRRGREGWVDVELSVDADGHVIDATVIDSQPRGLFERAALRAVRQWAFEPPRELELDDRVRGVFRIEFKRSG